MRLLTIFCLLFSFGLMAKDYKSLQRLNEGDVISAEVFNDIMDRIELTLKPLSNSELIGTWIAKHYVCHFGEPGSGTYCDTGGNLGSLTNESPIFKIRRDTVTISDNGDGTLNWVSPNLQLLDVWGYRDEMQYSTGSLNHTCSVSNAQIFGCHLDDSIKTFGGEKIASFMNIKRTSPSQIVLSWGPYQGYNLFTQIILDKLNNPPEPPTNLAATNADGTVSLSWTAPETYTLNVPGVEGAASSYKIKSKDAADGTYTELATATSNSYTDTITSGTTRWYRVYAVNEYGTSKGSNVVSISYSE